jgi:hypothetical protein
MNGGYKTCPEYEDTLIPLVEILPVAIAKCGSSNLVCMVAIYVFFKARMYICNFP